MTPITTTAELSAFCDKIKGQPFVAVDTEFMRETTYWPKLCLIQAAAPNAEAVIDPLAEGLDLEPFLAILRDESIEKVFHAARQDVEIFNNLILRWQAWRRDMASKLPMTPWSARC
jgi:ribonuclease D